MFKDNLCIAICSSLPATQTNGLNQDFFSANDMATLQKSQANKHRNCDKPPSQQCLLAAACNKPAGK